MKLNKRGKALVLVFLFLIIGCSVKVKNNTEKKKQEEKVIEKKEYDVSMIMAGDVLIHGAVYLDAKTGENSYDFKPMLSSIKPIVSSYDLAFVNQETIIGGKSIGLSHYPRFNSPEEVGDAVIDTGFNIINLTNNHTMDRGVDAVLNSLSYWKSKDVYITGSYNSEDERKPIIIEKNGIKIGLIGYTTVTNGLNPPSDKPYLTNIYSDELAKAHIESIKDKVDVVMVSMHWGVEYTNTPVEEQTRIADYLSSLGVNVIIGHHPHVIEPITYVNNTLVIYSLGNFISGQIGENQQTGMLASFNIHKTVEGDNVNVTIDNVGSQLIYTHYTSGYKNYHVYPYTELNNDILNNYESVKEKYIEIVKMYNEDINVK